MNFHDFVAEPVNPVHIFHDAHRDVSLCLFTSSSQYSFGLPLTSGEWKV